MIQFPSLINNFVKNHALVLWWLFLLILITWIWRFFPDRSVFLLDYVPTPLYVRDWNHQLQQSWVRFLHNLLIYSLWYIWWSKLYLLSIFLCSLGLWYARWKQLNKTLLPNIAWSTQQRVIVICMTLFVANPFFSARYGTQPWVRLSIVLLWRALFYIVSRWWVRTKRDFWIITLCLWTAVMWMVHASFMVVLLLVLCFCFNQKNIDISLLYEFEYFYWIVTGYYSNDQKQFLLLKHLLIKTSMNLQPIVMNHEERDEQLHCDIDFGEKNMAVHIRQVWLINSGELRELSYYCFECTE